MVPHSQHLTCCTVVTDAADAASFICLLARLHRALSAWKIFLINIRSCPPSLFRGRERDSFIHFCFFPLCTLFFRVFVLLFKVHHPLYWDEAKSASNRFASLSIKREDLMFVGLILFSNNNVGGPLTFRVSEMRPSTHYN